MAIAKRHYLPGHVWHLTHQATLSASTRQVGVIKKNFYLNLPGIDVDVYNGYLKPRIAMVFVY